ncbi:hypothetical protein AMK22_09750 [Streptomyces sp. CB01580]|nr:hypothetical protein AMK22_09750 [Streptomyces sp. CB01580]
MYACDSLRICAAAASRSAFSVSVDCLTTSFASGSFRAPRAASRFAFMSAFARGVDVCANTIAFDASLSQCEAPLL